VAGQARIDETFKGMILNIEFTSRRLKVNCLDPIMSKMTALEPTWSCAPETSCEVVKDCSPHQYKKKKPHEQKEKRVDQRNFK